MSDKHNSEIFPLKLLLYSLAYSLTFLLDVLSFFSLQLFRRRHLPFEIYVNRLILVLSLFDQSLTVQTASRRLLIIIYFLFYHCLYLLLNWVVYFRAVVIDKLSEGNQWCIIYIFTEGSIGKIDKYRPIISKVELLLLENRVLLLALLKLGPLSVEWL